LSRQRLSTCFDIRLRYLVSIPAAVRHISTRCWLQGGTIRTSPCFIRLAEAHLTDIPIQHDSPLGLLHFTGCPLERAAGEQHCMVHCPFVRRPGILQQAAQTLLFSRNCQLRAKDTAGIRNSHSVIITEAQQLPSIDWFGYVCRLLFRVGFTRRLSCCNSNVSDWS